MALSIMPSNEELKKLVTEITKDINLSLKQAGSIPDILSSGPWTINYLNQLRLLAYSPHVLPVTLKPRDGGQFRHIKYNDLSPAIVQVVGHATNAFHSAHKNMNLVQMQARALFGNTGLAQDILIHLQSPDGGHTAKRALWSLKDGMKCCSDYMDELELALTKEAADSQQMEDRLKTDQEERKAEIDVEKRLLRDHEDRLKRGEQSLKEAQESFKETTTHPELKLLGLKTLSDIQGVFSGTLGAAVNIVKEAPNIALTGLKAVGNFGNILSGAGRDSNLEDQGARPYAGVSTVDQSLQSAGEIGSQVSRMRGIIEDGLPVLLQSEGKNNLLDCIAQMKAINARLGEGPYFHLAEGILKQGIELGGAILDTQPEAFSIDLESHEWGQKFREWQRLLDRIEDSLLQLRAAAATQVGQGFGNTTSSSPSDLNGINLQSLMIFRQNKLMMMETAMRNAQDNVQRITRQNQATQNKMIELTNQMEQLDHSKAKLKDTKKVLLEAIEVLYEIKGGFNKIKKTFDFLAGYIDIRINHGTVDQLTFAMEAGQGRMRDEAMLCYQIQARTIVDMVLQMRGHFMFICDMSKLYSEISQDYIVPCIEHMGNLKVSKLITADQQEKEKAQIIEFTKTCSEAIIRIAQEEMDKFQQEMAARCGEIREESRLEQLDKLVSGSHREAIIKDAMSKASERLLEQETARIKGMEEKMKRSSDIINDTCFD